MADKRKRIYYTKSQIKTGLVTSGKEWMFTDNTEYIGQYHTYTTGEIFSEASFVDGKSRILIPYVDTTSISDSMDIGINNKINSEYDSVKTLKVKESKILNPTIQKASEDDIKNGYMFRYFAYKVNDEQIIELNKDAYGKVGTPDGMDGILWKKFKIKWKITGSEYDIINKRGDIEESGIVDTNMRTVALFSEDYPSLMDYIIDFRKFATT